MKTAQKAIEWITKGAAYTGNMKPVFLDCGFTDVTSQVCLDNSLGMKQGDVLLNIQHHTALYIGNRKMIAARINENGNTTGGQSGDQNGMEIMVQKYYNYPWDCVLRYQENNPSDSFPSLEQSATIRQGQSYASHFIDMPVLLTGVRDSATKKSGIRVLQTALNLDYGAALSIDGIWGPASAAALGYHYVTYGETQYMVTAAEILILIR